ncbi:galactitol utilization operon repressor [Escherichia coli]|uniref:Galactitol utilization operon repressor n=1 Tax=Escherichia coli TaxID=562 RepID=A0A376KR85_ECOLX|nr:galactitol utilization operon repressor [Escherichia coli]
MTMNSFERRNKIIQLVNEQGTVLVQDLAGVFAASEATIRADLRLSRTKRRGYALSSAVRPKIMSGNSETETQEVGFKERFQLASAPKNRIAQAAVKMIHEGMTVILDSGSNDDAYRRRINDRQKYHGDYQQSPGSVCPFPKIKTLLWSSAVARSA